MLVLAQNMKGTLIGAYVLLMAYSSHAQIEKGTTSLGGAIDFSKSQLNSSTNGVLSSGHSLNLTPSYARFVTDNIMLKGRLSGLLANSDTKEYWNSNFQNNTFTTNNQLANLELEARYYFNPKANWKFFGGAALGWTQGTLQSKYFTRGSLTSQSTLSIGKPSYSIYGGVNKFLNKEIALEGALSYSNTIDALPIRGLAYYRDTRNIGLNISLNNFTNYRTADKDFSGLVDKGRTVMGGNISVFNILERENSNSWAAKIDLEYGYFLTKGLLVGVKSNIAFERDYKSYTLRPYVQYLYPVSKRLLLHAKAEAGFSYSPNNVKSLALRGGVGATYFLSKHIAIDFDALNFTKTWYNSNLTPNLNASYFNPQMKLRFFF